MSPWRAVMLSMLVCGFVLNWIHTHQHPSIKVVYLVPSDVAPRPNFEEGARRSSAAAQLWFLHDLGTGVTFKMSNPLVETVNLTHPELWYRSRATSRSDREKLWQVTLEEAFEATRGSFNHEQYTWIYFLDADLPEIPPQGTDGVVLLTRKDFVDTFGPQPSCWTVGEIVHELGHAYGLHHPKECDSHEKPDSDPACASMSYMGAYTFPNAVFLPFDREILSYNRAFVPMKPEGPQVECIATGVPQTPQQ